MKESVNKMKKMYNLLFMMSNQYHKHMLFEYYFHNDSLSYELKITDLTTKKSKTRLCVSIKQLAYFINYYASCYEQKGYRRSHLEMMNYQMILKHLTKDE